MLALLHGAADTAWIARAPPVLTIGCPGRYGASCAATPIGPIPGPPPPCGMLNVLCRLIWQTSAPSAAGLMRPTCASAYPSSIYTTSPRSWHLDQPSRIVSSKTSGLEG